MTDPQFEYSIEPEKWPSLLTKELKRHFSRMGEESVQWDVSNHRYGVPEKHYAALYWLGQKRKSRQRLNTTILLVAIATLAVSIGSWRSAGLSLDYDSQYGEPESDNIRESVQDSEAGGSPIVETEDYIACVASQAHWSGMEIVFTRQRRSDSERWLADGFAVQELAIVNAIVTGQALYTEYEKDSEYTVERKPYRFEMDIAKGKIDVWTYEHYGKKAGEGKAFHFNGICAAHEPAMKP